MGGALGLHQGGATHSLCCGAVCGGGIREGTCRLLGSCSLSVTSPATHKQTASSWCRFLCRWVCICSKILWTSPVDPSSELFTETESFSCLHNSHRFLQPEVLRLYFPHAGTLGCVVCLAPQLFFLVYPHVNVRLPGLPADASPVCQVHQPPHLRPGCPPLPFLPVWMTVSFLTSQLLDFHTVPFSGSSGCFFYFKLAVILLLVV